MRPSLFRARVWRPAVKRAELAAPLPTPHALRHAAVSHRIAAGVEPFKLAKWAGHRSISTILRLYGHLLDVKASEEREALSVMREAARGRRRDTGQVLKLVPKSG